MATTTTTTTTTSTSAARQRQQKHAYKVPTMMMTEEKFRITILCSLKISICMRIWIGLECDCTREHKSHWKLCEVGFFNDFHHMWTDVFIILLKEFCSSQKSVKKHALSLTLTDCISITKADTKKRQRKKAVGRLSFLRLIFLYNLLLKRFDFEKKMLFVAFSHACCCCSHSSWHTKIALYTKIRCVHNLNAENFEPQRKKTH